MPYDPFNPDEELSFFDRVMGKLRSAAQSLSERIARNAQEMQEMQSYGMGPGERAMGGGMAPPIDVSGMTPEQAMAGMRTFASPIQSVGRMGGTVAPLIDNMPGVSGGVGPMFDAMQQVPDQIFGSPEEHIEAGFSAPMWGQLASNVGVEGAGILAGGMGVGSAMRAVAPAIPRVAAAAPGAGRVERLLRAAANVPSSAAQLAGSTAPATRTGGIARDFLRFAPVEGGLAAADPYYSTAAGIGEMRGVSDMLEQIPEEDRPKAMQFMAALYDNSLGRLPEGAQGFLTQNPLGRAAAELPMTAVFSPFGAFDADVATRRIDDVAGARDAVQFRGGLERLTPGERGQYDEVMRAQALRDTPVFDQPQLPPARDMPDEVDVLSPEDFEQQPFDPEDYEVRAPEPEQLPAPTPVTKSPALRRYIESDLARPIVEPELTPDRFNEEVFEELRAAVLDERELDYDYLVNQLMRGGISEDGARGLASEIRKGTIPGRSEMDKFHGITGAARAVNRVNLGPEFEDLENLLRNFAMGGGLRPMVRLRGAAALEAGKLIEEAQGFGVLDEDLANKFTRLLPDVEMADLPAVHVPSQYAKQAANREARSIFYDGIEMEGVEGTTPIRHAIDLGTPDDVPEGVTALAWDPGTPSRGKYSLLKINTEEDLHALLNLDEWYEGREQVFLRSFAPSPSERANAMERIRGRFPIRPDAIQVSPEVRATRIGEALFGGAQRPRTLLFNLSQDARTNPRYLGVDPDTRAPNAVHYNPVPGVSALARRPLGGYGEVIHMGSPTRLRELYKQAPETHARLAARRDPMFASRLEDVITKLGDAESTPRGTRGRFPKGTTAEKWKKALSREQFDTREMEFRGLDRWLDDQNPDEVITAEDIMEYLRTPDGSLDLQVARFGENNLGDGVEADTPSGEVDRRARILAEDMLKVMEESDFGGLDEGGRATLLHEAQRAFEDSPIANLGVVRLSRNEALTNAVDIFTEMNGERVYVATMSAYDRLPNFNNLRDFMEDIGVVRPNRFVDTRESSRYEVFAHPSARKNPSEYIVADPEGDYPDTTHWSMIPGGHPVHVRMADVTVMDGGREVSARMINEVQSTPSQRAQKHLQYAIEMRDKLKKDLKNAERALQSRDLSDIDRIEIQRDIEEMRADLADEDADIKAMRRTGGAAQPRRVMGPDDSLPSGRRYSRKEHNPFQKSSDFAGLAVGVALRDAANTGTDMLVVTPGRVAAKYATGTAESLEHMDALSWDDGVLTAYENGYLVQSWTKGEDFQSLSEVVTPAMRDELLANEGITVPATLELLTPPRGGIDEFYDGTFEDVMDGTLRRLGANLDEVKTKVTIPAVPGKDPEYRATAYRISDELAQTIKSTSIRMLGVAGLGAAIAAETENEDIATPIMAMALFGVPGGTKKLKGLARGAVDAVEAGRRSGLAPSQVASAIASVGLGIMGGGGIGAAVSDDDPGYGFLVGAALGAATGGAAAHMALRRLSFSDSEVMRALSMSGKSAKFDKMVREVMNTDTRTLLNNAYTNLRDLVKEGAIRGRSRYFDELGILDHIKWRTEALVSEVKRGRQTGPDEHGIWWRENELGEQGMVDGEIERLLEEGTGPLRLPPGENLVDPDDLLDEESAAVELRRAERYEIARQLTEEANTLMRNDPDLEMDDAMLRAREVIIARSATEIEKLEHLARDLRGSQGFGERSLEEGAMAPGDKNARSESFLSIVEGTGEHINEFTLYAIARRVQHLEATGRADRVPKQFMPGTAQRKELDAVLAKPNDVVVDAFDRMQAVNREWMHILEEEGVLAPGAAEKILASVGDAYVPFFRDTEKKFREGLLSRATSLTRKGDVVRRMLGSEEELPLLDPLEAYARLHYQFSSAIARQRAANQLAKVIPNIDPSMVRRLKSTDIMQSVSVNIDNFKGLSRRQKAELEELVSTWRVREAAKRAAGDDADLLLKEVYKVTGMSESDLAAMMPPGSLNLDVPIFKPEDRVIRIYNGQGQPEYYKVLDEDLWYGIHGADPIEFKGILGMAQSAFRIPAETLRILTTSTPMFQIANLFRDTSFAGMSSSEKSSAILVGLGQAWWDMIGGLSIAAVDSMSKGTRTVAPASVGALGGYALGDEDRGQSALFGAALGAAGGTATGPLASAYLKGTGLTPKQVMNLFSNTGATQAAFLDMNVKNLGRDVRRAVAEASRKGRTDVAGRAVNMVYHMHPLEALRKLGVAIENANRVGEFTRGIKNMQDTAEGVTREGLDRVAANARDVTVDFSRKGSSQLIQILRPMAAFWGAGVQSMDKLYRLARTNPKRLAGMGFASITAPSLMLYSVNRDDPEYWKLPDWQKNLTWPIPNRLLPWMGDEGFTLFPKPFEFGLIFGSFPERVLEYWDRKGGLLERIGLEPQNRDPQATSESIGDVVVDDLLKGIWENLTPDVTLIQPFIENTRNKDFTGLPIVNPFDVANDLPPYLQGYEGSSQLSRWMASLANQAEQSPVGRVLPDVVTQVSPAQIDNILQGWTGTVGREVVSGANKVLRDPSTGVEPAVAPERRFLVRRFQTSQNPTTSAALARLYERVEAGEALYKELNELTEVGQVERARQMAKIPENADLLEYRDYFRRVRDQISEYRALRAEVESSTEYTAEQKREGIDYYNRVMNEIAEKAMGWGAHQR